MNQDTDVAWLAPKQPISACPLWSFILRTALLQYLLQTSPVLDPGKDTEPTLLRLHPGGAQAGGCPREKMDGRHHWDVI